MTLEEISYIGQAVAAVAVLVSLVAVYGQLQQNNKIARADLTHSIWLNAGGMNLSLYDTPEKAELMHRALYATAPLTEPEKLRLRSVISVALGLHEAAFNAHKRGFMEDGAYKALEQGARLYLLSPCSTMVGKPPPRWPRSRLCHAHRWDRLRQQSKTTNARRWRLGS